MARRTAYSNGVAAKCAHSASVRAIFDFMCSVLFGALHFFAFSGKEMPLGVCI